MARIRKLPPSRYPVYLRRARQYERQLSRALEEKEWETASVCAIHLGISAVDALTCALLGQVWSGEDHAGAADLLRTVPATGNDPAIRHLLALLESNSRVEYGAEAASAATTVGLGQHARRLFEWVVQALRATGRT
ncbi:MAG: hypothetical protein L3K04_00155 [Thermoplasmata archaeon]|nr:hypothetical protein [Thermoplasmata archaeon]MCI4337819.1 hypothetical protein [Thermoplasmata archaeon]MCI4341584.1 hypothetical protein [Thermoplasmata archaeon]